MSQNRSEGEIDNEDGETGGQDELIVHDEVRAIMEEVGHEFVNCDIDEELEKATQYKCDCQLVDGGPCYKSFSLQEIVHRRSQMHKLTPCKCFFIFVYIFCHHDQVSSLL